jgi:hypothetical protein
MDVENLKRWHWILLGSVVGLLATGARLAMLRQGSGRGDRTTSLYKFMDRVVRPPGPDGLPPVRNIVVYPEIRLPGANNERSSLVTCEILERASGKPVYKKYACYTPAGAATSSGPSVNGFAVREFLDATQQTYRHIHYRTAWWATPPMIIAIWGGGSLVLVGGVWPLMLSVLSRNGFGRKTNPPCSARTDGGDAAIGVGLDDGDGDKWDCLESPLTAQPSSVACLESEPKDPDPLAVRPPETAPLPASPAEREHHYRGQYYPVDMGPGDHASRPERDTLPPTDADARSSRG